MPVPKVFFLERVEAYPFYPLILFKQRLVITSGGSRLNPWNPSFPCGEKIFEMEKKCNKH